MLDNTMFSFADAGAMQIIAFIGFAISTIGFAAWVAWLARE
jgi:hypothetical protein